MQMTLHISQQLPTAKCCITKKFVPLNHLSLAHMLLTQNQPKQTSENMPPQSYYSPLCFLLSLLLVFLSFQFRQSLASSSSVVPNSPSIYQVLKSHGLPMGLLPKGVTEFSIDESGKFQVHLDQACNAKFESELHYDRNVSGTLSYGQIAALSGISAQELFLWFPVKGIHVDVPSSGLIYFDVGVVFKQFSLSLFETPPDCTAVHLEDARFVDGAVSV